MPESTRLTSSGSTQRRQLWPSTCETHSTGRQRAASRWSGRGPQLPMTRLSSRDGTVECEERWPADHDLGSPVLLPGGEVGILLSWWNAADES
ncbi:MAG: hypothetical protein ABIQ47_17645 [Tepidiformaceae bacterium]